MANRRAVIETVGRTISTLSALDAVMVHSRRIAIGIPNPMMKRASVQTTDSVWPAQTKSKFRQPTAPLYRSKRHNSQTSTSTQLPNFHIDTTPKLPHRHNSQTSTSTQLPNFHIDTTPKLPHRHNSQTSTSTQLPNFHIDTTPKLPHRHNSQTSTSTQLPNFHIDTAPKLPRSQRSKDHNIHHFANTEDTSTLENKIYFSN
ncbi:hypothetical protein Ddc_17969 [Ditylenchus destructor]|nr:hypothetical protein Ddc_17969 [Ditylenchus destructor]